MNHYGLLAMDFCRRHRPIEWSQTPDPSRQFETLGDQIQADITSLRDRLMGSPRPGENPTSVQRRSAQNLATAEELVLADHPALQPEPTAEEDEDRELSSYRQSLALINEALNQPAIP
jgi:hypothetical protein